MNKKKENRALAALIYIIVAITVVMIFPLIYKALNYYSSSSRPLASGIKENAGERNVKNKKYNASEINIELSALNDSEFGILDLIEAKVLNNGDVILFCSGTDETNEKNNKDSGEFLIIAAVRNNDNKIEVSRRAIRYDFVESFRNQDYVFRDYNDGTVFISNKNYAFLFDVNSLRTVDNYGYPADYNIYQTALSSKKNMLALATEQGFFVSDLSSPSFVNTGVVSSINMKEIISARNINGVSLTVRNPVWSGDDEHIYYKLYADNSVRNAGATTPSPGGNEQLTALEGVNFIFIKSDTIFYYFLSGTETNPGNSFRCGYFNLNEKKMIDVMKSQAYYFDIDVSLSGTHLAALSHNGNMVKISVIDIRTKKLIASSLYSEIYSFSFSPDERNVVVYGLEENNKTLKVININWTEE